MKQHYVKYMLAGMLTVALLSSGCGSSRKASSETVRSDSLSTSVTERTTYAPVPKRTANLSVNAEQWLNLTRLPEGYGISTRQDGLNIDIKSDGEGGVNVTATADSLGREVTTVREETTNHIRDETVVTEQPKASIWERIGKFLLPVFVAILLIAGMIIYHKLKK
jgi:hypothetical protein